MKTKSTTTITSTNLAANIKKDVDETTEEVIDEDEEDPKNHRLDVMERTIYVGNLPLNTTRKMLTSYLIDCGTILSTRIRSIPTLNDAPSKLPKECKGKQAYHKLLCIQLSNN